MNHLQSKSQAQQKSASEAVEVQQGTAINSDATETAAMGKAFYVPNQPWFVDYAIERADGVMVSELAGLTLEQIKAKYPGAILITCQQAQNAIESLCKTVPRPIDDVDFEYAQTALANYGHCQSGDTESFMLTEHKSGRVTAIYARIGAHCWTFNDVCDLSHAAIVERVLNAQPTTIQ